MSNKDLISLENRFKDYYDKEGNENNLFVGDLFSELYSYKMSNPEMDLNEILKIVFLKRE